LGIPPQGVLHEVEHAEKQHAEDDPAGDGGER
jgi:hypothetical protein